MHSLLEEYLSQVAAHLSALPPKRRAEELREIRAHLESVFAASRQQGQTEDEAAQNAAMQFGAPGAVGRDTVVAWRRGAALNRLSFWGAAVTVMVSSFLLSAEVERIPSWLPRIFMGMGALWVDLHYAVYAVAGMMSGLLFPRRAVAGTAVTAAAWLVYSAGPIVLGMHWVSEPGVWVRDYTAFAALAVLGAWAGSRWRVAAMGRVWPARE